MFRGDDTSLPGRRGLIAGHEVTTGLLWVNNYLGRNFRIGYCFFFSFLSPYLSDRPLSHDFLCWL